MKCNVSCAGNCLVVGFIQFNSWFPFASKVQTLGERRWCGDSSSSIPWRVSLRTLAPQETTTSVFEDLPMRFLSGFRLHFREPLVAGFLSGCGVRIVLPCGFSVTVREYLRGGHPRCSTCLVGQIVPSPADCIQKRLFYETKRYNSNVPHPLQVLEMLAFRADPWT
jgi:hypothetical protein